MTFEQMVQAIDEIRAATDAPFGVNMRTDALDIDKRVDYVIKAKVPVASFAQAPGEKIVKKLKDAGIVVMPTIGARRHAEKVAAWGVDAVIAQGQEGGGHTGFVPTTILVPQVLDAVDIPVLAAGGIFDGRGLAGQLAVGASGVAMGTRFLMTKDSWVADVAKERYLQASVTDTIVTRAIDGAPQRVIRTPLIDRLEKAKFLALPKAAANALRFRKMTGTSFAHPAQRRLGDEEGARPFVGADGDGGQRADDDQGRDRRRSSRGRYLADWSRRGRHRRSADVPRAHRPHRRAGDRTVRPPLRPEVIPT